MEDNDDHSEQCNQMVRITKLTVHKLRQELTMHNFGVELLQLKNAKKNDILLSLDDGSLRINIILARLVCKLREHKYERNEVIYN
ncbi:hypothetical protein H5410_058412 [Solanum commersonii]|uniref:Uncharacterized protein n=1 Tax=Solanum commersonii TaxID=4109 RepID=A0A9J5WTJ9_SOLCO|nr:hypothetical protein H5410_058412 [Solanum commersonii]